MNDFDVEEAGGPSGFGSTAEEESLISYNKGKSTTLSVAQLKLKANARLDPKVRVFSLARGALTHTTVRAPLLADVLGR
jgi:hypothetical protein